MGPARILKRRWDRRTKILAAALALVLIVGGILLYRYFTLRSPEKGLAKAQTDRELPQPRLGRKISKNLIKRLVEIDEL